MSKSQKGKITSELTSMRNIGKEMSRKLIEAGITSPAILNQTGAKNAFLKIKLIYSNVCLVHLYTLQGAIENVDFRCLSEKTKSELKEFSDAFK